MFLFMTLVLITTACSQVDQESASNVNIVAFNQGNISKEALEEKLIATAGLQHMLDMADKVILDTVEPVTSTMQTSVEGNVNNFKNIYKENFEQTIFLGGFESESAFIDSLLLEHQRKAYTMDYIQNNLITAEAIQTAYDDYVDSIAARHILIKPKDKSAKKSEEARLKALEIIERVKSGEDFAELAKALSDDPGSGPQGGNLGTFGRGKMVKDFETAAFALEVGTFTKNPIKTKFGYHIILRTDDGTKKSLEDMAQSIKEDLAKDQYQADKTLTRKAMIHLRADNGFSIKDDGLSKQYELYKTQILSEQK